jgi:predicted nucleotidyltransferase
LAAFLSLVSSRFSEDISFHITAESWSVLRVLWQLLVAIAVTVTWKG